MASLDISEEIWTERRYLICRIFNDNDIFIDTQEDDKIDHYVTFYGHSGLVIFNEDGKLYLSDYLNPGLKENPSDGIYNVEDFPELEHCAAYAIRDFVAPRHEKWGYPNPGDPDMSVYVNYDRYGIFHRDSSLTSYFHMIVERLNDIKSADLPSPELAAKLAEYNKRRTA